MQSYNLPLSGFYSRSHSQTDVRTTSLPAPRSFAITYPGQDMASSPTNPFPRRSYEVWMDEPHVNRQPDSTTNAKVKTDWSIGLKWSRISFDASEHPSSPRLNWHRDIDSDPLQKKETAKVKPPGKTPKLLTLNLSWRGKLGGSVNARVIIRRGRKQKGKALVDATGKDAITVLVPFCRKISIQVKPTDPAPNDRYQSTTQSVTLNPATVTRTITVKLPVNRWNLKNVEQIWQAKGIDPAKASKVKSYYLFGFPVQLNEAVADKIKNTNAAFEKLDQKTQQEIKQSILIIGGYAKRTTSEGTFSEHSVGCAIDINYNMSTKQNYHFKPNKKKVNQDKALLNFVQTVVRCDSAFSTFDIMKAKGEKQLAASQRFNELFPDYLLSLLETATLAAGDSKRTAGEPKKTFDSVTEADLDQAIKVAPKGNAHRHLVLIRNEWKTLRAWINGTEMKGAKNKGKKLVGMIPLHKTLLKLMLDNGWEWGGDWANEKDYMHFEDKAAFQTLKQPKKQKRPEPVH